MGRCLSPQYAWPNAIALLWKARTHWRDRRGAVLLTAMLIAALHNSPYDLMLLAAAVLLVYRDMLDGIAIMPSPSLLLVPWFAQLALVPRSTVFGFGVPAVILGMLLILVRLPRDRQPSS